MESILSEEGPRHGATAVCRREKVGRLPLTSRFFQL